LRGETVTAADVARLIAWYADRQIEPRVQVCAYTGTGLLAELATAGFGLREFELVLARDLTSDPLPRTHGPADLAIEPVDPDDDRAVAEFARVVTRGFYDGQDDPGFEAAMVAAARYERSRCLMARLSGTPVAGGSLELYGDLGALFCGSVLPEARGLGIHFALMAARLRLARDCRCRLATVGTRPGATTERNAWRCGMQPSYSRAILVRPGPGLISNA
jgi:GNAT superfamily N-acetyltransferase